MNAAKSPDPIERVEHFIKCSAAGCGNFVRGIARAGEYNADGKAAIMARRTAREADWRLAGMGAEKKWTCPVCVAREVWAAKEDDKFDRTEGAVRRQTLVAKAEVRERMAKRQVEQEKAAKRQTRPVGDKIAKTDETLTKDTPKLINANEFDRVVVRHLHPRHVTAADEWRRKMEEAEGVSDREAFTDKVDKSVGPGHPSLIQLAALEWRAKVGQVIGQENIRILDLSIGQDLLPREIGQIYCTTKDQDKRSMVGMAFIKAALSQLADYMGLRR